MENFGPYPLNTNSTTFYQFLKILMRGGGPNYIQEIESVHHIYQKNVAAVGNKLIIHSIWTKKKKNKTNNFGLPIVKYSGNNNLMQDISRIISYLHLFNFRFMTTFDSTK